ncbi:protein-cysteine N-palmitoyltransferase HHAT-like [Oculina patagonica]
MSTQADMKNLDSNRNKTDQNKKHGPLPFLEISLYWVLWISLSSYAMYSIFRASQDHKDEIYEEDLKEGWQFLGKKDVTDFEWEFWTSAMKSLMPAMLLHTIGGLIFSRFLPQKKPSYCLMFTLCFLLYSLGFLPVLFMVGHCLLVYTCCFIFKSIPALWICTLGIVLSLQTNAAKIWQLELLSTNLEIKNFTLFVSMMGNLRCISFGMDYVWRSREVEKDKPVKPYSLMDLLVYNFYFPLFANGPVVTFDTFQKTFYQPFKSFSSEEIKSLLKDTARTLWWYFFLEGYLHFFYSTAFTQDPSLFTSLSNWALTGIMYSQLNIFLLKYKVFYCCTGVLARVDRVEVPLPPRCVTTLWLFTDMWKYFDRGLNVWMKRYIYVPLGGSRKGVIRQMTGSFLAFAFIWLWHGGHVHTMWWFIPNWLGVVVESVAGIVLMLPSVKRLEDKLSPAASRRVRAIFGVVTLTCLILSNLVFLCGSEPVWFYIKRIFLFGWPSSTLLLLFTIYLIVQTNMELNRHITEW